MTGANVFQILGLAYLAGGLGMTINPRFYNRMYDQMLQSAPVLYLSGIMALLVGFLLVTFFTYWGWDWRLILTLVGWIAMIKGLTILILPELFARLTNRWRGRDRGVFWQGALMSGLGVVFLWLGFFIMQARG